MRGKDKSVQGQSWHEADDLCVHTVVCCMALQTSADIAAGLCVSLGSQAYPHPQKQLPIFFSCLSYSIFQYQLLLLFPVQQALCICDAYLI